MMCTCFIFSSNNYYYIFTKPHFEISHEKNAKCMQQYAKTEIAHGQKSQIAHGQVVLVNTH